MIGLAIGDALGASTELMSVAAIVRRFGPHGPQELTGSPARVTDDTQMALAVAAALAEVGAAPDPARLRAVGVGHGVGEGHGCGFQGLRGEHASRTGRALRCAPQAGAFAGAHLGLEAWPADWRERIEYRDELLAFGALWDH